MALLVLDDAAFAPKERVQKRVDVRDRVVVEANGPVDENMTGAGGESDRLWIATGANVHLPVDPQTDIVGARVEHGKYAR